MNKNNKKGMEKTATPMPKQTASSDWLTPEEIKDLRRDQKEAAEYMRNSEITKALKAEFDKLRQQRK